VPGVMALTPYKPNRGLYARGAAGGALLLLALLASVRLTEMLGLERRVEWLGIAIPVSATWGVMLFLALGAVIAVFTFGLETGWKGLDSNARAFVDLLIDTENELQKVSWPNREELRRSTTVVLICVVVLGAFIAGVDFVLSLLMSFLDVLPR